LPLGALSADGLIVAIRPARRWIQWTTVLPSLLLLGLLDRYDCCPFAAQQPLGRLRVGWPDPGILPDLRFYVVGATGFEPVTPSVSGHARPFARSIAAVHGTTSALLTRVTEPGTAV
jgi:hypothetical protein